MWRLFAYRIGYFDICRLYIDDYSSIDDAAKIEADLQKQARTQNQKGIPSGDMNLIFTGNSAGYETAIKELCNSYRKDPLIIITPFMFSKTVTIPRLEDNIYYSMRILLPKSYGKCDMVII